MSAFRFAPALVALAVLATSARGMYLPVEVEKVPIDRLTKNLQEAVRSLSEYGIVAISCQFERDPRHPDRIAFSKYGVTFKDGHVRPTFDLVLYPANQCAVPGAAAAHRRRPPLR